MMVDRRLSEATESNETFRDKIEKSFYRIPPNVQFVISRFKPIIFPPASDANTTYYEIRAI